VRPAPNDGDLNEIRIGLADANSGIDMAGFSVTADFVVNGRSPRTDLSDLFQEGTQGVYTFTLAKQGVVTEGSIRAEIFDMQGNKNTVYRDFSFTGIESGEGETEGAAEGQSEGSSEGQAEGGSEGTTEGMAEGNGETSGCAAKAAGGSSSLPSGDVVMLLVVVAAFAARKTRSYPKS